MDITKKLFPEHKQENWLKIDIEESDISLYTEEEIAETGSKIKTGKAAGPDGIHWRLSSN